MSRNFNTPKDLPEYLEFFAREAIRAQPSNMLKFNRIFLEELEKYTDGSNMITFLDDPEANQRFQKDLLQRTISEESHVKEKNKNNSASGKVDEAATKIQANVRGFLVRKAAEKK